MSIFQCCHCGSDVKMGTKLCEYCRTADKRQEADAENLKLNPKFICKFCEREKRQKEFNKELKNGQD